MKLRVSVSECCHERHSTSVTNALFGRVSQYCSTLRKRSIHSSLVSSSLQNPQRIDHVGERRLACVIALVEYHLDGEMSEQIPLKLQSAVAEHKCWKG